MLSRKLIERNLSIVCEAWGPAEICLSSKCVPIKGSPYYRKNADSGGASRDISISSFKF